MGEVFLMGKLKSLLKAMLPIAGGVALFFWIVASIDKGGIATVEDVVDNLT